MTDKRPTISEQLFDEAFRFDFFQAVRLLERLRPERTPVGRGETLPNTEVVRFRTRTSLDFPASQIHRITDRDVKPESHDDTEPDARPRQAARRLLSRHDAPPPAEMLVAFMGLTGPLGTLPTHYTELLQERLRYKDTALWEFLDLFNHRIISLFYRAWEKYRFHIAYERGGDPVTEHLFDIIGLGTDGLQNRLGIPDEALLFYSGNISARPRAAVHVASILTDYFGVPAKVEQFTGQWLPLDDDALTRLGTANSELGETTVIGSRVWDAQSKFRLSFGALTFRDFKRFLPTSAAFAPVGKMTRLLVGMEFDFDLELILRRDEVPEMRLGGDDARLGWTSWLKTKEFVGDDPRVVFGVSE